MGKQIQKEVKLKVHTDESELEELKKFVRVGQKYLYLANMKKT